MNPAAKQLRTFGQESHAMEAQADAGRITEEQAHAARLWLARKCHQAGLGRQTFDELADVLGVRP